ncbi:helix-turn-helix transcriptional regulator [Rhodococcus jostii]|uniref:ATP-, maltotriose-and DNA-dependent transcriptional regulator MalT n=1 Tax=Rhodococcus jostii TaxID=132919 RepID=A0A1H5LYS9_RHOJO|nr:LuxR family transcriptional regulator [Rhodococcus jostii]SEE82166.1 ATP-, maltotriose-and DNA-dependent transcriptional regulator MalT [Rhodococcus jostii]
MLLGRATACRTLDRLLCETRSGHSGTLVLRGDPGIGKSALLDYLAEQASGCRVVRARGVESEMELAFSGLHQLCAPMLHQLERLPAPQRDALGIAFGLRAANSPDRFLVGLAVLSLLSEVAEEQPLVCLIDDMQWLDHASVQALAFAGRRLLAEPVLLVFAVREIRQQELLGLPDLVVDGIGDRDARQLLTSAIRGRLDAQVLDRIIAETHGNPLALLELPRGLTSAQLAGGFGLPTRPLASRIEQSFRSRLEVLPPETQLLLLTASAEPVGDAGLLWRAAGILGIDPSAAAPAEDAGLLELGSRVQFRHPLVRSAAYKAATLSDRRKVHRALAEATDQHADPDRRAWHRARAAPGPDETVAAELEHSAGRAQGRGGVAAAAAFLERAAELTPESALLGTRALAAAQAKFDAGSPDRATELLATVEMSPLDDLQRARAERLRAQITFARNRGSGAPALLLGAARRLSLLDAGLARETYLEMLGAVMFAGRFGGSRGLRESAEAARAAPPGPRPPRAIDLLLDGLATRFIEGYAAGVPQLKNALRALNRDDGLSEDDARWLWLACRVATDVWDDESWHELASLQVRLARSAGALNVLPIALTYRAGVCVHAGEFAAASALIDETETITQATGNAPLRYTSLVLAAWRGQEPEVLKLTQASLDDATRRGEGRAITLAEYATAVLYNGFGQYQAAFEAAQKACEHDDLGLCGWALIELIEAAARNGRTQAAAAAFERLEERTRASGTDWALGIEARSRALLSDAAAADALYREAIERLTRSRIVVHLFRARLLYGEWLRRENHRSASREHLRAAHEMFSHIGADGFAERARRELLATGETARKRTVDTFGELTAQEGQIARLACDGYTNPEIGGQLFISSRTVEWHLRKVYTKLGIGSRRELRNMLAGIGNAALPT